MREKEGYCVDRKLWEACIASGNNGPLWAETENVYYLRCDLRSPAYHKELEAVCRQFGLGPEELHIQA